MTAVDELEQAAADVPPELHPTDWYLLTDRTKHEPLFDAARLPTCPHCARRYVPIAERDGSMSTSHGVVDGTPVCVGVPLPAAKPTPRRVTRAQRAAAALSQQEQIEAAAQHIYVAALANRTNFKASVWRIPMDKAGVPPEIRRHAIVHAVRAGWISAIDVEGGFEFGDGVRLEQYDRRHTRWRSHIYQPLRRNRRRPTTNGPTS